MNSSRIFLVIGLVFVLLALRTAQAVPIFEASDEAAHFLYVHHLLESPDLPVIPSRDEINARAERGDRVGQWSIESHQPPLYYAIGALLVSLTERDDVGDYLRANDLIFIRANPEFNANKWLHTPGPGTGDTQLAVWVLRLYSVTLGLGTLWFVYLSAREVVGIQGEGLALTAVFFVAMIPTFVTISGSVNNDNLVTLLYSIGVYGSLRVIRYGLNRGSIIGLSLILSAAALTKITGLSLFGVVYLALLIALWRGRVRWREALIFVGVSLLSVALLAGWWYLRNLQLYGDPLALAATQTLWGREFALASESGDLGMELSRLWRSFWMMTGHLHFPVYGSNWVYGYAVIVSGLGMVGLILSLIRYPSPGVGRYRVRADAILLLFAVIALVGGQLAFGTRSVDITYGRLLFPALTGIAVLLTIGWTWLFGRFAALLILPLAFAPITAPVTSLHEGYPPLMPVGSVPGSAIPLNTRAGDLNLVAYERNNETVAPGDFARFTIYLRGAHPDNPALYATLIDPLTSDPRGDVAVYPGMAPTDSLDDTTLYRADLRIPVHGGDESLSPRRLMVQFSWRTILDTEPLPLINAEGDPVESLLVGGPTLIDPRYRPPTPALAADARFGDAIVLEGFTLDAQAFTPSDTLTLDLHWRTLGRLPENRVATVQLLDAEGTLVAQDDGDIPGYPATAWRTGGAVVDRRTLTIPADTMPGPVTIHVGWYDLDDFSRLPVRGDGVQNNLYPLPVSLEVTRRMD